MAQANIYLFLTVLVVLGNIAFSEEYNSSSSHSVKQSSRTGRKNYPVYNLPVDRQSKSKLHFPTQADAYKDEKGSFQPGEYPSAPESSPESEVAVPYFPPSNNYPEVYKSKSGTGYSSSDESMYKSESNANYNVWKGFPSESGEYEAPVTGMKGVPPSFEDFQFPSDSWNKDKMAAMITLMNEMKEEAKPKPKPKPNGLMSKLKKDPSAFLLAAAIPISILLAAILPALMNNMVAIPTVSTIVTGSKARKFIENQFISPIIDGISTFGARALEDPGCIQRTFCEVTNESSSNHRDSRILQRVLHKASTFVDDKTLDNYGVKKLFESMSDGNCEKVPCSNFNLTDYATKYSSKKKKE